MINPLAIVVVIILPLVLVCCGPEVSSTQTHQAPFQNDSMDISTWDFGEVEIDDSSSSHHVMIKNEEQFSIVIATFTGQQHANSAAATKAQLAMQYPQIGQSLVVRPRSRGSALTFGQYSGYDDPQAKKDMAMLRRAVSPQGRPIFAQVLLMKFKPRRSAKNLHPYDLWTVRREFPTMVPIFTLEVAVWGDFDSGQFPESKRRQAAEGYASQLRQQGYEAFFYHNDDAGLSSVTVGLFGHNAVDGETGFYSPEVDAMISRFPVRVVNGQEVQEYFDPKNRALGSSVQPPCLAEVPVD